jgi:hypothetical protein
MDDAERMITSVKAAALRLCAEDEPLTLSAWERRDLGNFLYDVADRFALALVLRVSVLGALTRDLPRSRN